MLNSLLDNIGSLVLALLLSLMVWMVAVNQGQGPPVRQMYPDEGLPIETVNLEEGLTLYDQLDRRATMEVLAPQSNVDRLSPSDFRVYIDLSDLASGVHEVPVQWQCAECAQKRVDVLGIEPEAISVRLEETAVQTVPVRPNLQGSTAVGYRAQFPAVTPEEVEVSGPRSLVEQVEAARADIYLFNEDANVAREVRLTPVDAEGNLVTGVSLSPERAEVTVPIAPEGRRKEVAVTPNITGSVAPGYYSTGISVEPQTVVLTGPPSRIREAPGFVETEPVSIAGARSSVEVRVSIQIPEGLQLVNPENETVRVTVDVSPFTGGRSFEVAPTIQGLGQNFEVEVSPPRVQVFLSGSLPEVEALTEQDIQVVLDLSELEPGRHRIAPTVQVPQEDLETRTLPEMMEVSISQSTTPTPEVTVTPSESAR